MVFIKESEIEHEEKHMVNYDCGAYAGNSLY